MRAALVTLVLSGCMTTLSEPHSAEHVAAMREATRHHHHGRFEEAAESWEVAARSADRRVDRDEADNRRARTNRRRDRDREALELLDDIGQREPLSRRTVRARFDAALIRLELGETSRAHETLERILRERPGDGPAGRSLRLLLDARSAEEQLAFVRELYERVGDTDLGDDLLFTEAELLAGAGDRPGAIRVFERIVVAHPYPHGQRWDDSLWRLADLAQESGDHEAAIVYLRRMIEPHTLSVVPGSHTLPRFPAAGLRIARIYRDELDDPEHAAESFRAMRDEFGSSALRDDALYELGAMWLDRGRVGEGCAVLREVVAAYEVGHPRRLAARRLDSDCAD